MADNLPHEARRLVSTLMALRKIAGNEGNHEQMREYDEQIRSVRDRYDE